MSARPPDSSARALAGRRKRNLVILCSIGIAVGLAGTIVTVAKNSSPAVATDQSGQRAYEVTGFDRISAVAADEVVVSVGPGFSVHGTGAADALDHFEVVVANGALKIEPKHHAWWGWPWSRTGPTTFHVTLPQLSAVSFVGSGDMKIDKVSGQEFAASLAGSGQMEIDALAVDDARFSVAGSGDLSAAGRVGNAHVSVAGSGDMKTSGLTSDNADLSMVGSGDAALTVNGDAHVSIVGSGDVAIGGSAHCTVSRLGSGDVECPAGGTS